MKHIARKRFGQNFLQDPQIVADIVGAVNPPRDGQVVEIGPGLGALTVPLMARVDHLHVVEIDRDLIARLKKQYPKDKLTIHEGDALEFDFGQLGPNLQIVGNLPYNISTPLLFHLASFAPMVRDMHFMLQKEVVERMVALPGESEYSRLSVMLQYRFYMDWLLDVPPESFDPAPKVDSAVVRLIPRPRRNSRRRTRPCWKRWCRPPSPSGARCCATPSRNWAAKPGSKPTASSPRPGPKTCRWPTTSPWPTAWSSPKTRHPGKAGGMRLPGTASPAGPSFLPPSPSP